MQKQWFLIIGLLFTLSLSAQMDTAAFGRDTTVRRDTTLRTDTTVNRDTAARTDTAAIVAAPPKKPSLLGDTSIYNRQPYFSFTNPTRQLVSKRDWEGKEPFFYATVALLIFFALVRNSFSRYSQNLFSLFFRTTLKQRQVKEHLMQSPLPSLLLNILFFLSGGLFINLLLDYFNLTEGFNFWFLLVYCIAGLALVYIIKFISLKIFGWILRLSEATDTYAFIVFTTNKIMGIALLPFIILLSFTSGGLQQVAFTLSLIIVGGLFVYRYFLSYISIHRQVKINFFHFLLYLAAFEILPLLLINKVLFKFLGDYS